MRMWSEKEIRDHLASEVERGEISPANAEKLKKRIPEIFRGRLFITSDKKGELFSGFPEVLPRSGRQRKVRVLP